MEERIKKGEDLVQEKNQKIQELMERMQNLEAASSASPPEGSTIQEETMKVEEDIPPSVQPSEIEKELDPANEKEPEPPTSAAVELENSGPDSDQVTEAAVSKPHLERAQSETTSEENVPQEQEDIVEAIKNPQKMTGDPTDTDHPTEETSEKSKDKQMDEEPQDEMSESAELISENPETEPPELKPAKRKEELPEEKTPVDETAPPADKASSSLRELLNSIEKKHPEKQEGAEEKQPEQKEKSEDLPLESTAQPEIYQGFADRLKKIDEGESDSEPVEAKPAEEDSEEIKTADRQEPPTDSSSSEPPPIKRRIRERKEHNVR